LRQGDVVDPGGSSRMRDDSTRRVCATCCHSFPRTSSARHHSMTRLPPAHAGRQSGGCLCSRQWYGEVARQAVLGGLRISVTLQEGETQSLAMAIARPAAARVDDGRVIALHQLDRRPAWPLRGVRDLHSLVAAQLNRWTFFESRRVAAVSVIRLAFGSTTGRERRLSGRAIPSLKSREPRCHVDLRKGAAEAGAGARLRGRSG
jgi:hypothetical protein